MPCKIRRLDLNALPSSPVTGKETVIPDYPVAYVIFNQSEVFYVGATKSLYNRWSAHRHTPKFERVLSSEDVRVAWIAADIKDLSGFAMALIRFLKPRLNDRPNRIAYYHAAHGQRKHAPYRALSRNQKNGNKRSK